MAKPRNHQMPDDVLDYLNHRETYYRASFFERGVFGRSISHHTTLSVMEFWCAVFEANEMLPGKGHKGQRNKKLTDAQIANMLRQHFPDRDTIQRLFIRGPKRLTVNYHRQMFNKGRLLKDYVAPKYCHRYNSTGEKVEPRHGRRKLKADEITLKETMHRMYRNNYKGLRDLAPPYFKNTTIVDQ